MNISYLYERLARVIAVIAIAATPIVGCDNPVEENGHEHAEAEGLAILQDGTELLRVVEREPNDTLRVPLNDTTAVLEVEFLDEEGHEIHAEDLEGEFEIEILSGDANVVEVLAGATWSFRLRGVQSDTASIEIGLLHLPQRHYDLQPIEVPVVVE